MDINNSGFYQGNSVQVVDGAFSPCFKVPSGAEF